MKLSNPLVREPVSRNRAQLPRLKRAEIRSEVQVSARLAVNPSRHGVLVVANELSDRPVDKQMKFVQMKFVLTRFGTD